MGEDVHAQCYDAGGVRYRLAEPQDDGALRRLLREHAMDSWVQLSLEREPDYFAAEALMGEPLSVIAQTFDRKSGKTGQEVGMYHCERVQVNLNGKGTTLGYLGALRVTGSFRNRLRILRHGFESIPVLLNKHCPPFFFTSIATENNRARRLLEAGLSALPRYRLAGEIQTLAIACHPPLRQRAAVAIKGKLQTARVEDVEEICDFYNRQALHFQFSPVLTRDWLQRLDGRNGLHIEDFILLREHGCLKAVLALWDQRGIKQTVACGYRFPLNHLRPLYNQWARLWGRVTLPPVGGELAQVYLAFAALDKLDIDQVQALLYELLARVRQRGAKVLVWGLNAENPQLPRLKRQFHPAVYCTRIDTVSFGNAPKLDPLPVQPEVALL